MHYFWPNAKSCNKSWSVLQMSNYGFEKRMGVCNRPHTHVRRPLVIFFLFFYYYFFKIFFISYFLCRLHVFSLLRVRARVWVHGVEREHAHFAVFGFSNVSRLASACGLVNKKNKTGVWFRRGNLSIPYEGIALSIVHTFCERWTSNKERPHSWPAYTYTRCSSLRQYTTFVINGPQRQPAA